MIGLHLTYRLASDCLALAMFLRNRRTGTDHLRCGGPLNELAGRTHEVLPSALDEARLESIVALCAIFDKLATEHDPAHRESMDGLDALLRLARGERFATRSIVLLCALGTG